ncbi:leucine-rich repeat and immunoglobulin-like domain-containing nogo receptor-interacting protein 1 [Lytechinus pictus]|uniref:leucine-rich repeat and immunoglobulin-like domain-containing nogo receptor-interacting protein 1 n=1 Tax=Lytechinus pictus TaxID=7653 RepID=UPI0030BA0271
MQYMTSSMSPVLLSVFLILCQVLDPTAAIGCIRPPSCDTDEEAGFASMLCGQRRLNCIPQEQHHARFLDMHGNRLTNLLQDAFRQFYNLERLDLSSNEIASITPGAFSGLHNLTSLILKGNRIQSLSASTFSGATKLETLDLSRNNISTITVGAFNGLSQLRTLYLNENQLDWLRPGMLQGLPRLALLSFHSNGMRTIDAAAFRGLTHLRALQLNNNNIATMDNVFNSLPSLSTLWIGENPWECDCRMEFLRRLLVPRHTGAAGVLDVRHPVICTGPSLMRGLDMRYVNDPLQCTRPIFKREKFEYLIARGQDVSMTCDASGIPSPALSWVSPRGEPIPSITVGTANMNYAHAPRISVRSDGSLNIRHAQPNDAGNYTCLAQNPGGQAMAEIRVTVVNEIPKPTVHAPGKTTPDMWPRKPTGGNEPEGGWPNQERPPIACIPERSRACDSATGVVVTAIVTFLTTLITCVVVFYLWYRKQTAKIHFASAPLPNTLKTPKNQSSMKPTLQRFINAISNPAHLYAKPKPTKNQRQGGFSFHKASNKVDDASRHIIAPLTEKPSILSQGMPEMDAPTPPPMTGMNRSHPKQTDQKRLSVPRELLRNSATISRSSHLYENATALNDDPNYTALDPMTRCIVNDTYVS